MISFIKKFDSLIGIVAVGILLLAVLRFFGVIELAWWFIICVAVFYIAWFVALAKDGP